MKKSQKMLLGLVTFAFLTRFILAIFIKTPSIFSDEYIYLKVAQSIFQGAGFNFHGTPISQLFPLYPLVISVAYLLKDMNLVYISIKLINSIISSLIIIPIFLIAKDFLNSKKAAIITLIISLLAVNLLFPIFVMSENLFYVLSIFYIYFLYQSFKTKSKKYFLISGAFLALAFLTRLVGVALVPVALIVFLMLRKKFGINFKKIIYHYLVSLIIVVPWLVRNLLTFGPNISALFGTTRDVSVNFVSSSSIFVPFINWLFLYAGYLLLASGILFGMFFFFSTKPKDQNFSIISTITFLATFFFVIVAANHSAGSPITYNSPLLYLIGRPLGRYLGVSISLITLLGYITYTKFRFNNFSKSLVISSSIILLIASQLTLTTLFPLNNQSLSYIGLTQVVLQKVITGTLNFTPFFNPLIFGIMALLFFVIPWIFYSLRKTNIGFFLAVLIILINSIASYGLIYGSSNLQWSQDERIQIGMFLDKLDNGKSTVMIDSKFEGKTLKTDNFPLYENLNNNQKMSLVSLWLTNDVVFDSPENNKNFGYLITRDKYDLELVKETDSGIYLYKNSKK